MTSARPTDAPSQATYPSVLTAPSKSGPSLSGSVWESFDEIDLSDIRVASINEDDDKNSQGLEQPMYYIRPQHPSATQVVGSGTGGFRYVDGRVKQGPYSSGSNVQPEPPDKALYGFVGVLIGALVFLTDIMIDII